MMTAVTSVRLLRSLCQNAFTDLESYMKRSVTVFGFFFTFAITATASAQPLDLGTSALTPQKPDARIVIDYITADSSFIRSMLDWRRLQFRFKPLERPMLDTPIAESDMTKDSVVFEFRTKLGKLLGQKEFSFIIPESPAERIYSYIEPFSMIDFNRVNGFFLGIGRTRYINYGRYDEIGLKGGIGYGFEDKKGQNFLGAEYRIPLETVHSLDESAPSRMFRATPTLALGAEYHNITSTEDYWRAERIDNATYAFFAREDFRDYFKIKGWEAHLAYRPERITEARIEYRSDIYSSKPQLVFYGRWGGNKALPVNPPITEGRLNSWVATFRHENIYAEGAATRDIFGDNVSVDIVRGRAYLVQVELGDNHDIDSSFVRYILDARNFMPVFDGLNIDTRLRYEASTGTVPYQKMQFLGGPSTLPAYKNKVFAGNRMLLLNTEVRLNLALLSSFFKSEDVQLLLKNDFGYIASSIEDNPFTGFGGFEIGRIIYNIGVGIGNNDGGELGVAWRTDISESPRFFLRWQRPF